MHSPSPFYRGLRRIMSGFHEMSCAPLWERNCKCQVISLCDNGSHRYRQSWQGGESMASPRAASPAVSETKAPALRCSQQLGTVKTITDGDTPQVQTTLGRVWHNRSSRLSRCSPPLHQPKPQVPVCTWC